MTLSFPFYKLCPGGNPTLLICDEALAAPNAAKERSRIARELMHSNHLSAEQVGFIDVSRSVPHMEMMGGEFCVNAARCAAVALARMGLFSSKQPETNNGQWSRQGHISASGAATLVPVRVKSCGNPKTAGLRYESGVALSLPASIDPLFQEYETGKVAVRLPGITHVLLDEENHAKPQNILSAATAVIADLDLEKEDAAGVVWHAPAEDTASGRNITPVVHVPATKSTVPETACGSGSLALALWVAYTKKERRLVVRQPSGMDIVVSLNFPQTASEEADSSKLVAWIDGPVFLVAEGVAFLPDGIV